MTRRYNRAATTSALLEAAIVEFSDKGIHGARVDAIAAAAGSNKAAIYSYFGDKEEFFAAAIAEVMARVVEAVPISPHTPGEYAGLLFDYMCVHPEVERLYEHESLYYSGSLESAPDYESRARHYRDRLGAITEALGPDKDASAILVSIIAMVNWYFAAPQVVKMIFGAEQGQAPARYRAHIVAVADSMATARQARPT